jgi:hypothetical protein
MTSLGVRGLFLAGEWPESALMALAAAGVRGGLAVAVRTVAGRAPAFGRSLARLELDPAEIVQAGFEMLGALERAAKDPAAQAASPVVTVRILRPRFIEGETLPRRPG